MTKDEALKLALEALQSDLAGQIKKGPLAITAIKEAMAQPEQEQEPEAWYDKHGMVTHDPFEGVTPLYTTPPQRTWVGLTGFEQKELMAMSARGAVFATEAKLKQKNGYAEEKNT